MDNTYFYKDKPIFGLDVGFSSVKVMQIDWQGQRKVVTGYGVATFEGGIVKDGIIVNPEPIAKATFELFNERLIGDITTRRVCLAIPAARTYTRSITLPKLSHSDLTEAVRTEAEQYIPMPLNELYIDHTIISQTDKEMDVLAVAVPRIIVDSYMELTNLLGLEVVAIESTIGAASRLFVQSDNSNSDVPSVLIDFGSMSSDITIYDQALVVTGTVPGGGDSFTNLIAEALKVSKPEAHIIKTKYGLGVSKKQNEINAAMTPLLEQLVKEIRRMIRYYEERGKTEKKIGQAITMGGGANMPGLSEYLTSSLRLPVRMCDPWQNLDFKNMQPPNNVEKSMYVTVAGSALVNSKEAFNL
ncbi:MAG: type IV pilus assembly protein PilM [Candidatus Saccharimonadales bacterium]